MASTAVKGSPGEVACPIGGCEYSGEPASVAGHINGKHDRKHKDARAKEYEDHLYGPPTTEPEEDTDDENQVEGDSPGTPESGEGEGPPDEETGRKDEVKEGNSGDEGSPPVHEHSASDAGFQRPSKAAKAGVPPFVLVAVIIGLVLLYLWLSRDGSSGSSTSSSDGSSSGGRTDPSTVSRDRDRRRDEDLFLGGEV